MSATGPAAGESTQVSRLSTDPAGRITTSTISYRPYRCRCSPRGRGRSRRAVRASSGSNSTSGSEGAAQRRYMTSAGHCLAKLLGVSRDAVVYCPAQTHQRSVYLNNVDCHCGDQCAWASSGCFLNNVGCPSLHGGTASSETSCILLMYALDHCTGSAAADHWLTQTGVLRSVRIPDPCYRRTFGSAQLLCNQHHSCPAPSPR